MDKKGFDAKTSSSCTPNFLEAADKPLLSKENKTRKVDINILKARAQEIQAKENKKNISIFVFFFILLGVVGVYLSI